MTVQFVKFSDGEVSSAEELAEELFEMQLRSVNSGMMNLSQRSGRGVATMLAWVLPLGLLAWGGLIWLFLKIFF